MRVVITGGPGTGKTTLIQSEAFSRFKVVPEVARGLLKSLSKYEPEKFNNKAYIQDVIETLQIKNWEENKYNTIFDRGLPDEIAYRLHHNRNVTKTLINKCEKLRYDKIFILPFWREIYINDDVRTETLFEARLLEGYILHAYQVTGYDPIIVPIGEVHERVNFILKHINNG